MRAAFPSTSRDHATLESPPRRRLDPASFLAPLAAIAAGVIVFHRTVGQYFSQEDFLGLARAAGLAPRLTGPWRYLSLQTFFDVMRPLAGLDPAPYHAVALLAHTVAIVLLWSWLTRLTTRPAATVGAVFFAAHPASFTALYWISAMGDVLALVFALATILLVTRRDAWRWLALPAFALSLLSKESTLLLPLALPLLLPHGTRPRWRDPVILALGALAAAQVVMVAGFFAALVGWNGSGTDAVGATERAYAVGWNGNLWQNALTYLGWTANFLLPTVTHVSDSIDPGVYGWGVALLAIWLACLVSPRLRARGWVVAGALWLVLIAPVLPLRHHTNRYYLYASLAAAAWCAAALVDGVLAWQMSRHIGSASPTARARKVARNGPTTPVRPRLVWAATAILAALMTVNGYLLVAKVEHMPFVLEELRADPTVDRQMIARNVLESLASARLPDGVVLRFWSPVAASIGARGEPLGGPAPRPTYWEANVRDALYGGLAVRVALPQVAKVEFVHQFVPTTPDDRYAVYRPNGRVRVVVAAEVDSILRGLDPDEAVSTP
jgi:hypothetical protein